MPGFAYIGVLIDDLINKGTDEPYRMFTSRAEYRTLLRQDNADLRLTELGHKIGLATDERLSLMREKQTSVARIKEILAEFPVEPAVANPFLEERNSSPINERSRAMKILLRPGIALKDMNIAMPELASAIGTQDVLAMEQAEIQLKYDVYIEKEKELVKKMATLEDLIIPDTFDYNKLSALSSEARQKLEKIRPHTLGQASRISGVNPSDVQILMVYMGR